MAAETKSSMAVFGYIRREFSANIFPSELAQIVCNYAMLLFGWVERDGCKWQLKNTDDGFTATAPEMMRSVLCFGPRLYHQNKTKMEATFRLDGGHYNSFGIGFIVPSFDDFTPKDTYQDGSCFMWANGWFVCDKEHFKCKQPNKSHGAHRFFQHLVGDTVTLFVDMETKVAKLDKCKISLPDVVQIAIISGPNVHVVTALKH